MPTTSSNLISKIQRWAAVPTGQPAFSTSQYLAILTDELRDNIVPLIISIRGEYFVTYEDTTIAAAIDSYEIPSNAIGNTLREVKIISGNTYYNLPHINIEDFENQGTGFYMRGNFLILNNPSNFAGMTLRMWYEYRPNELIAPANAVTISSIDTSTNIVTCSSILSSWDANSDTFDLVKAVNPYTILANNETVTISGNDITFSDLPDDLSIGDYVSLNGYSPVANIPEECQSLLARAATITVLEAIGADSDSVQMAVGKYKQLEERVMKLLSHRVQGEYQTINTDDTML